MFDVFILDMGGHDDNVQGLVQRFPHAKVVRYYDNHLDTIRRCVNRSKTSSAWILSSCCDYTHFDFSYRSPPWEEYQLHCWASGDQKFGDTFLINKKEFEKQQQRVELLEWYHDINWHEDGVPRLPFDKIVYTGDNLVNIIKSAEFTTPYCAFIPEYTNTSIDYNPALWRQKLRNIVSFSTENSTILAPKDVQHFINTQVYDYPYIEKLKKIKDPQQDIIFISYDEPNADENYAKLIERFPQARRLHGVKGMENALLEAAKMSRTDWYYAVFAKTELHPEFDFSFSPDLFQQPKHYIFHAENPMNDLEYGHMGVILYNCNIVKNTETFGIDYTLSSLHEVVPIVSAIARFNSNPYQTWRTAFRESSKLAQFCDEKDNVENEHRLEVWLNDAQGEYSEWCLQGARDGYMFYMKYRGFPEELQNAFDWQWLKSYFTSIYQNVDNPDLTVLQQRQELWQPQ